MLTLDSAGIAVSASSSCNSLSDSSRSYVIDSLNKKNENKKCALSSVRFTLGRYTKKEDVSTLLTVLKKKRSVFEVIN